jgi:hypothetical protein
MYGNSIGGPDCPDRTVRNGYTQHHRAKIYYMMQDESMGIGLNILRLLADTSPRRPNSPYITLIQQGDRNYKSCK